MFRPTALLLLVAALGHVRARVAAPPPTEESDMRMMGPDPRDPSAGTGDTGSSMDRYVDMHMGFSQMYPGMRVWGDITAAKWRDVPAWLMGMRTMTPSSITSAYRRMEWHCAPQRYTGVPYCDAYVFMYHCPGCDFRDGDLAPNLVSSGWEIFRCTPTVEVDPASPAHRMLGFHKRVPAGTIETLVLLEETGLVTYAMERKGKDCTDYSLFADAGACTDPTHKDQCAWVDGSCVLNQCTRFGPPTAEHCSDKICLPQEIDAL